jgi:hypothetical protein
MDLGRRGIRSLAVARTREEDGKWTMLGILTFLDPPRPDTKETIERAMEYGVDVKMITGVLLWPDWLGFRLGRPGLWLTDSALHVFEAAGLVGHVG